MHHAVYHLALTWRHAKFLADHPTVPPDTFDPPLSLPKLVCFVPRAQISNVIAIRDWLHDTGLGGGFRLLGRFERFTSAFLGLVVSFDNACDLRRFRAYWAAHGTV